jgi:hypothetical protein
MVASANADRMLIENLRNVVGVETIEIETEDSAALGWA